MHVIKSLIAKALALLCITLGFSCGGDIDDCPSKMCVLAGGWKLTEVYIDGVRDTQTDLSKYQLTLLAPEPTTAETSLFTRVNPSGRGDQGQWEMRNNDEVLALLPSASPEEAYIIKSFSPRQLVLVIEREEDKTGPSQYEFVLEPF